MVEKNKYFQSLHGTKRKCPKDSSDYLEFQVVSPILVDEFFEMLKSKGEIKTHICSEDPLDNIELQAISLITAVEYLEILKSKVEIKIRVKLEETNAASKCGTVVNKHKDCECNKQLAEFRAEV